MELGVLAKSEAGARAALLKALPIVREPWEPETTLNNLRLIRAAFEPRGDWAPWMGAIEAALEKRAKAGA